MSDPKQFPPLTDFQIAQTMIHYGGSFVRNLGMLFRLADDVNKAKIKNTWPNYWEQYTSMTRRCPECCCTDILDRHHDGLTSGVPECSFNECEKCQHQWGHQ